MPDDPFRGVDSPSSSPVEYLESDRGQQPEKGIALCLSGGGYRAMVFHLGSLWRLNEMGLLSKVNRFSSVSGGSITAGTLALNWSKLAFDGSGVARAFVEQVIEPVRRLASETIDIMSVLAGVLGPGSVSDRVAAAYREHLFGSATLQDLPDSPRFVFNATNVQSKALWRFSKPYMRDWRVGEVPNPAVSLATAVAASSAFPPFLSPLVMDLKDSDFTPGSGADLQHPPYTTKVFLTDGGVYDNLGLETAWKRYTTVLVSDGGGMYEAEPEPKRDWVLHMSRVVNLIDNQVRSLRKRQVMDSYQQKTREGAYWGVWTDIAEYHLAGALDCPFPKTRTLANTPTRLECMEPLLQERLINWGYAVCDAAMRTYGKIDGAPPAKFPYAGGVG
jgi:NTE family protein